MLMDKHRATDSLNSDFATKSCEIRWSVDVWARRATPRLVADGHVASFDITAGETCTCISASSLA